MLNYLGIIEDYIQRPKTNYALMINGDWGNGKTYFLQNEVFPRLEELGKKPIYITLNGIKTVEEVSKQIYFSTSFLSNEKVKKVLDSKSTKFISNLAKMAHNAASVLGVSGSVENTIDYEELIGLNENVVLCFDDLERCKIDIVEILGYINNFVEHDDAKTIIVGNEKEINDINIDQNNELKVMAATLSLGLEESHDHKNIIPRIKDLFSEQKKFDVVKEKLVGKTIFFEPDFSYVIGEMIRDYKDSNFEYYSFLLQNKDVISIIHEVSLRRNLRILKHSLSDFLKIFTTLYESLNSNHYWNRLIISYFVPALILSIEHKEGKIGIETLLNKLSSVITPSYLILSKNDAAYYDKYLTALNSKLGYYESQYITSYIATSILDEEKLIQDANMLLSDWDEHEKGKEITSLEKLTNYLLELDNEEFEECVADVLVNVENSIYELRKYNRIYSFFETFIDEELINMSKEELNRVFDEGIKGAEFDPDTIDDDLQRFLIRNPSENQKIIEGLIQSKIDEEKNDLTKKEISTLINLLPNNVGQFVDRFIQSSKDPAYKAILQFVDMPTFYEKINQLNNSDLQQIRFMFQSMYDFGNLNAYFKSDYENLNKLIAHLKTDLENSNGVRKLQYRYFIGNLEEYARRINQ
ncbi:hypothetical protein HP548_12525 [Paenibacillus taichungensis]|uniref:KAP NTPase domain-containing protein n=1 Tax=Paenibacillus taichungensis TaxID=484184 RepID=A0ABX2MLJ5_9BACL|nr:P-loop NTPase fold protein [Paenibacillus taichungensis]NUU54902.1 hypothetical protein [Paenibacillus taichungensis]